MVDVAAEASAAVEPPAMTEEQDGSSSTTAPPEYEHFTPMAEEEYRKVVRDFSRSLLRVANLMGGYRHSSREVSPRHVQRAADSLWGDHSQRNNLLSALSGLLLGSGISAVVSVGLVSDEEWYWNAIAIGLLASGAAALGGLAFRR